ncbi:MAG TPA: hypothetical protein DEA63_00535, partial [Firmicutes bacterium]|nr:hypothetical protein [Bacillota bacterium]
NPDFEVKGYLSSAQIEIVKGVKKDGADAGILDLIDSFVRANGKLDAKYEALLQTAKDALSVVGHLPEYPQTIQETSPFLLSVALLDFFVLVGVVDEEEVQSMKENAMKGAGFGFDDPKNNQA